MDENVGKATRALIALLIALAALNAGCGADVDETEYSELNREAFLAACTDSGQDDRVVRDMCECTYDEIEARMTFDDLAALEESLKLDTLHPLPDEIAGYLAECFLGEVDL